jgi:hypothetical protein
MLRHSLIHLYIISVLHNVTSVKYKQVEGNKFHQFNHLLQIKRNIKHKSVHYNAENVKGARKHQKYYF